MGRLARSLGKHKAPKAKTSAEARAIKKATKQAAFVASEGQKQALAIQANVSKSVIGLAYIYLAHIMHVQEKVSRKVTAKIMNGVQAKISCVSENLTTWEDVEKYEIKATDKEYWPVKWVDYKHIQHNYEVMVNSIPAKTTAEMIYAVAKVETVRLVEYLLHNFELAVMSALHDYFGYGLKRLKRIIMTLRKMLYLSKERLHDIVGIVKDYDIFLPAEMADDVLAKSERYWSVCLLDPAWEGQHVA